MTSLCPSCGQRLPKHAAHCPACGASTTALPIESAYEPIGADPLVTMGSGGKGRRGWLLAAGLLVALGVGALVAGRAPDGATSARSTTTTARPTTTAAPPTTRATPSTTPRTTTTLAVTSTGGAVLPEPTGESLYTINATGNVYRIDLDTGSVTHSNVGRAFQDATIVALDNGALVINQFSNSDTGVDQPTVMFHVRVDGSVETVTVPLPSAGRLGAPGLGVWLLSLVGATGQTATLVTAAGETALTLTLPPGAQGFVPDGGGIAFVSASGIYRIDDQGTGRIATGELIALSEHFIVASNCDAAFRCTVTRTDRKSGHVDTIGPRPDGLTPFYQSGTLSPDGNMVSLLVYASNAPPTIHIYDLRTNRVHDTNNSVFTTPGAQVWTASGWSASIDNNTSNVVLTRGADTLSVDLPSNPSGPGPLAIAVGPTPLGAGIGPA